MSPEQLKGAANVDARADIWALGVSLYELLTGVVPFAASSAAEIGIMILRDRPVPPQERCPGIHVGLSEVIMRCLEKEPSDRYENVAKLAAALEAYSTELPSSVRERVGRVLNTPIVIPDLPVQSLPRPHADAGAITETDVAVDTKPRPRRRAFWVAATGSAGLVLVGLAASGLGVFALSRKPPANKTSTAATSAESTALPTSSLPSSSPPGGLASTPSAASMTPPERAASAASRTTHPVPASKKPAPRAPAIDARPERTDPAKDPVHL
jgi:serine/threonine-protein kinase